MRFYYISLFSLILLGLIYVFGTMFLVWLGKKLKSRWNGAWKVMVPLFLLLYIGPIAEELWIAWNFGQLCKKDAGIFIYKTVKVDGFFNGTGATLDLVRPGRYKFIEANDKDGVGAIRLEFGNEQWKNAAIARFEEQNPGESAADRKYIRVEMDDRTQALVYPKKGDSWRITKLDEPAARFHYHKDNGVEVAHKTYKQSSAVRDSKTVELLAQYKRYSRKSPWFFVALDDPGMACDASDSGSSTKHSFLIYRDVLKPIGAAD